MRKESRMFAIEEELKNCLLFQVSILCNDEQDAIIYVEGNQSENRSDNIFRKAEIWELKRRW